jgi:aminopeptidase N
MHGTARLTCVLLFVGLPLLLLAQGTVSTPRQMDWDKGIVEAERKAAAARFTAVSTALTDAYDLKYHRLEWTVDPAVKYISGCVTSYFQPVGAAMDTLYFDLSDSLTVDSVQYHGGAAAYTHLSGALLRITFPATINPGQLDSVSVWYHGAPVGTGFGSFIQGGHNGTPIIWTLSEPYGARDWWPCKNGITDKVDSLDMHLTAPLGNRVAGNGVLVSVTSAPGGETYHWRHRHPIATYLIAFAVTNYIQYSDWVPYGGDTLEILNYIFPEDSANFAANTPAQIGVMQLYDSLFGMYPFQDEKYGHAQFGWGGGMEHQTMSFVVNPDFELCAHELAHQWFGDKVTCGSWQDIWLNESWATYCSGLCYEHAVGGGWTWDDFKRMRIEFATSAPDGSVWCNDTTQVGRIFDGRLSYTKGAMVLHQLRWLIGDSAFFAGTRNYLAGIGYGFARTDDFKGHLEASSGRNLTGYFDDWYYGEGFPTYAVNWSQGVDTVRVELQQTASMPSSVPFFALPVPLKIHGGGQDTVVVLDNAVNGEVFSVPVGYAVDSITFDPERWLLAGKAVITGVEDFSGSGRVSVKVWPNPAQGFVNIAGKGIEGVELYDIAGRVVLRKDLRGGLGIQRVELPGVAEGVYVMGVRVGGKVEYMRLVVAHAN